MKEPDTQMMKRPIYLILAPRSSSSSYTFDANMHLPYVKLLYNMVNSDELFSQSIHVSGPCCGSSYSICSLTTRSLSAPFMTRPTVQAQMNYYLYWEFGPLNLIFAIFRKFLHRWCS